MTGRFTLRPPGFPGGLLPVSWFPSEALTMKTNLGTPTSGLTNSVVQRPVVRLPKCNSTRELGEILMRIGEMEGTIIALENRLRTLPRRIRMELNSRSERLQAARYLYWFVPDLSAKDIAEGLLGTNARTFLRHVGTMTTEIACDCCQRPIECDSREQMKKLSLDVHRRRPRCVEGYRVLCADCVVVIVERRARFRYVPDRE